MTVERQERALLDLIEVDRDRQCSAALAEAQARAQALRMQARDDALARIRRTFAEQHQRRQRELAAARSRLATQRRLHEQQRVAAQLSLAAAQLPDELCALWRDATMRQAWTGRVAADARAQLPASGWRVLHADGWPEGERRAWSQALAAQGVAQPDFEADATLTAGLKVLAQGNVVDGSLAGLLADRSDFESRLLRTLEEPTS